MTAEERQPQPGPRLKVDRPTADLIRRLLALEPGQAVAVVFTVDADGRRRWELGSITEKAGP